MKSNILESQIKNKAELKKLYQEIKTKLLEAKKENAYINDNFALAEQLIENYEYNPNSLLNGVFYSLKDNIVTTDQITTGGSFFLKNYVSPFDATVSKLLQKAGAINLVKANLDEFGLGGTGLYSSYGTVPNAINKDYICGGSSSGSAYLVAKDILAFSIGTDTGDSVRKPASLNGIVGFKPSYGLISRYGVYPFCPSLDTVGILTKYVSDVAIVLQEIALQDNKDVTTYQKQKVDYFKNLDQPNILSQVKFALFDQTLSDVQDFNKWNSLKIKNQFEKLIANFKTKNISVENYNFNAQYLDSIVSLYMIIAFSEASVCYANLTGLTFGRTFEKNNFIEQAKENRKLLGLEFKKRLVIGSYATSAKNYEKYYLKAKKIRSLINEEVNKLFEQFDFVILPGLTYTAPLISEVKNNQGPKTSEIDNILQVANFCGLPSITIPWINVNGLPVGLNIFSKFQNDEKLLQVAYALEKMLMGDK